MKLNSPFCITSRLLPGIRIGETEISIAYAGSTSNGRTRYRYHIDGPGIEHTDTDLKSGVGGGSLQSGMESLLTFLSACGESVGYSERTGHPGENADLFPPAVAAWCRDNSDELSSLEYELTETPNLIEE